MRGAAEQQGCTNYSSIGLIKLKDSYRRNTLFGLTNPEELEFKMMEYRQNGQTWKLTTYILNCKQRAKRVNWK